VLCALSSEGFVPLRLFFRECHFWRNWFILAWGLFLEGLKLSGNIVREDLVCCVRPSSSFLAHL